MASLRRVRGRDGAVVPFSQARLADSIRESVQASGPPDDLLADELGRVAVLFLEKNFDNENPPAPDDIRDMVMQVLTETGHARVARAYRRRQVKAPDAVPVMVSDDGEHLEPWDEAKLAASLEGSTGIGAADARDVAQAIRGRLDAAGIGTATTSLLREMIDHELAIMGLRSTERQRRIGVAPKDVEGWIESGEVDPEQECAARVLSEYSLAEIVSRPVAREHRDGRLHVFGLGQPMRVEDVTVDATGPLFPESKTADEFLLHLLGLLQALRPMVRRRVVVRAFSAGLGRIGRAPSKRALAALVDRLLDHLVRDDVFGRPIYPEVELEVVLRDVDLESSDTADVTFADRLLDALLSTPRLVGRLRLSFVLEAAPPYRWPDSRRLTKLLTAARRHSGISLRLLRERNVGETDEADTRRESIVLDVGAVGINLPLVLAAAHAVDVDDAVVALDGPVRLAIETLYEKYWFLRRSSPQTLRGILSCLPGGSDVRIDGTGQCGRLRVWGLPQAVAWLDSPGAVGAASGAAIVARLLAAVDYLATDGGGAERLAITVGGVEDGEVRRRFLEATHAHAETEASDRLRAALTDIPSHAPTLPLVSPLADEANHAVLRASFLERWTTGLPLPARGEDTVAGGVWLRGLFESTRLGLVEFEESGGALAVQEDLFAEPVSVAPDRTTTS